MNIRKMVRLAAAAVSLTGCTLISGVNDFEIVDPESEVRELQYAFVGMVAHAGVPLDVAVVDGTGLLQGRARIIMRPVGRGAYPEEELVMRNTLTPGRQRLFFFADNDGDGVVDGSAKKIEEHIWIEELDPDGVGSFMHSTNFAYFSDASYTPLNGDLVLEMPLVEGATDEVLRCIQDKLGNQLDVTLTLIDEDRQAGLFRRYRNTPPPREVRLRGVLDGGSRYRIQVSIDGAVKQTLERQAPPSAALVIKASEWFPTKIDRTVACR